eukprot:CAMPEP_0114656750 /NCGR_PEP_ID=MMETSP0191-20121206/12844_1 /TAXON_ID=126664 /ORGANISM="Sorites sp." /LENGTH=195 /DNA_ID=CAMNT_0001874653 /DNA_START=39 /DNA_END=626 /DNA_ORIENTATION=+
MALSMRFLAKASQSFESIVSHSPKAVRTPKTPKTPKTPVSPFGLSPLASLNSVNCFPDVEKVEKRAPKVPTRSVHFADGATWVGNATRLLGGQLQPKVEASHSSPVTDLTAAASATRDAVRARLARQADRHAPIAPVASDAGFPTRPTLLGRQAPLRSAQQLDVVDEQSCAHAAHKAFLEQRNRRASRAMVDFVV